MAPWNGSGVYNPTNGPYDGINMWSLADAADEDVRSDRFDAAWTDLKAVIENCLTRDGQNSPTADLPMGSNKHTDVEDAGAENHYGSFKQVRNRGTEFIAASEVGGTGDGITLTPAVAYSAYTAGMTVAFFVEEANTGAVTIDLSGLGTKALTDQAATALSSGALKVGDLVRAMYDGTRFRLLGATPGRTLLHSTSSNDWTDGGAVVAVTVPNIDDYNYLTFSTITDGGPGTQKFTATTTIAVSEILEDATPEDTNDAVVLSPTSSNQVVSIAVGRDAAGTTLYFDPNFAITGRIAAIWGGDF